MTATRVVLTAADVETFAAASHDRNPMHVDPEYARRTPFGRPIAHGMAAVVRALAIWSSGRTFRLTRIHARFRRPLYADEPYELDTSADGSRVTLRYRRGDTTFVECELAWEPWLPAPATSAPPSWRARGHAADGAVRDEGTRSLPDETYSPDRRVVDRGILGLSASALPIHQLASLLWCSYAVGMEHPGRQALFTECEIRYGDGSSTSQFTATNLVAEYDARFHVMRITGRGTGVDAFMLSSFVRDEPVRLTGSDLDAVPRSDERSGTVALISGSGRGFGAALACALAMRGAIVAVNARTASDVASVVGLVRERGGTAAGFEGDVALGADTERITRDVMAAYGRIDLLVNNASPLIGDAGFLELSTDELASFVSRSLAACAQLTRAVLPHMRPGAMVLSVSTIYLERPRARLTHYLAAKGAVEGLMRALAAEEPRIHFVAARLGRMLTDQTNVPFDLEPKVPAIRVATRLLDQLARLDGGNFHQVDVVG